MRLVPPPISLPKRTQPDPNGKTTINLDMSTLMSPAGGAWLVYMMALPFGRKASSPSTIE